MIKVSMPGDFSIVFSPHAMKKMAQRGLTREMVIWTLEQPSHLVTLGDRMHAFRKFGGPVSQGHFCSYGTRHYRYYTVFCKKTSMKYTYDPIADGINITFQKGKVAETMEIAQGVLLDVDKQGKPLYLEMLDVRKRFGRKQVGNLPLKPFIMHIPKSAHERSWLATS